MAQSQLSPPVYDKGHHIYMGNYFPTSGPLYSADNSLDRGGMWHSMPKLHLSSSVGKLELHVHVEGIGIVCNMVNAMQ